MRLTDSPTQVVTRLDTGGRIVIPLLSDAIMGAVNYCEVMTTLRRRRAPGEVFDILAVSLRGRGYRGAGDPLRL